MQADSLPLVTNHQPVQVGTLDFLYRELREIQLWAKHMQAAIMLYLCLSTKTGEFYGNCGKFL